MTHIQISLSVFSLVFLLSCSGYDGNPDQKVFVGRDYYRELPNSYKLHDYGGDDIAIQNPDSKIIVGPVVSQYSHHDGVVFGLVVGSEELDSDWVGTPGYFIIDTKTKATVDGMDKDEWIRQLEKRKITRQFQVMRNP
jgi:hypothetical protein